MDGPIEVPADSDGSVTPRGGPRSTATTVPGEPTGSEPVAGRVSQRPTERPDAVRRDPDASYGRAASAPPATERERALVSAQIGRPARGEVAVVHRCAFGLPTTVRVAPRLEDGTPFPTVFWLTCPLLASRIGRLETEGAMRALERRLARDGDLARDYRAATERYLAFRDRLGGPLPGDPTAGGMPGRVKCLHVHVAHTLATGDNPVGRWALEEVTPMPCPEPCVDPERPGG